MNVACRAQVSETCDNGKDERIVYGPDETQQDDGTWDGGTVVCDPCYVLLMPYSASGQLLEHEIRSTIRAYQKTHEA